MKKYNFIIISALVIISFITSCRKEEPLNVDFNTYNVDNPIAKTPLDDWLIATFLDEYNIDVIYRYNRFFHGEDRDIAAVKVEKVRPQMQTVLEGFILPYRKVAGVPFIKRMVPKQFVLFGSGSYNPDNSYVLATAAAGRNITIYDLNNFDLSSPNDVVGKLRTIHHEFTHTLNQIVPMPEDFQLITKSTYLATWTSTSAATARANGYVTPYASSQPGEDFAETVSHLLVNGQAWFDAWANGSTAEGKAALKAKEASVVQYFSNMGIDFRAIQQEVQNVARNTYQYQNVSFRYWMGQNLFKGMTINLDSDPVYTNSGISEEYKTVYNQLKSGIAGLPYGLRLNFIKLNFTSTTAMNLEINFSQGTGTYLARYAFNTDLNTTNGETKFTTGTAGGTGADWVGNADLIKPGVQPMLDYLLDHTFVAEWLPTNINPDNYNKYGGFYVLGAPNNYFYGQLAQ